MSEKQPEPNLFLAVILRVGIGIPLIALVVILPAWKWDYWQGWMYLGTLCVLMAFTLSYLVKNDPALLERRMRMREREPVQKKIIGLSFVYFLVAFSLPGFDVRFGWSNVPPLVSIIAEVFVVTGYLIFVWVMTVNSYLSRVVEVDAGQKVVTTGPYAIVRHPMYFGISLMYIATSVALGSYWAILPTLLILPLLVVRINNEEEVLLRELPGYAEYRQKVKFRLLPGIW